MSKHLKPDELVVLMETDRVQVVDVRSPMEFASSHIPGAVSIPMDQVESRLEDLQAEGPVVLACQSGRRAGMVCELLASVRPELYVLDGGTGAWIGAGYPVVQTTRTRWSLERQVRLIAGLMVLAGVVLGAFINPLWLILSGFVGAGLTFAGLTDICGMGLLLAHMPWNKALPSPAPCATASEARS